MKLGMGNSVPEEKKKKKKKETTMKDRGKKSNQI